MEDVFSHWPSLVKQSFACHAGSSKLAGRCLRRMITMTTMRSPALALLLKPQKLALMLQITQNAGNLINQRRRNVNKNPTLKCRLPSMHTEIQSCMKAGVSSALFVGYQKRINLLLLLSRRLDISHWRSPGKAGGGRCRRSRITLASAAMQVGIER